MTATLQSPGKARLKSGVSKRQKIISVGGGQQNGSDETEKISGAKAGYQKISV